MIEEYKILMPNSARELGKLVRYLILEGWQPLGPASQNMDGKWYQTMVRYEEVRPTEGIVPPKMHKLHED